MSADANAPPPANLWTDVRFDPDLAPEFRAAVAPRHVISADDSRERFLQPASPNASLYAGCDAAFGQPDVADLLANPQVKFVQLTTAGYTRYDRDDLRQHCQTNNVALCNASAVYAEPCAQHALALMLGAIRQLPEAMRSQMTDQGWAYAPLRNGSVLLDASSTVLIVGYGAIARRLVELLAPFRCTIRAFRRSPRGDENCRTSPIDDLDSFLPTAEHVMNILPASESTKLFFDAARFSQMKPGVRFYNIGRGDTVDQAALIDALNASHVQHAYLDVTSPEPLPPEHPLWTTPRCYVTPHTAGGWDRESPAQLAHFLVNLKRFDRGEPLVDRIM